MRILPNGKEISALGFGCSSIWSKANFPAAKAAKILEAAFANGINHFDTAPSYAEGEARLGKFLRDKDRDRLVISTKVGTEHTTHARSFDPERMFASFQGSLARLGIRSVDILYLHGPAVEDLTPAVFAFFADLKAKGLITYSGLNTPRKDVIAAVRDTPIDTVMIHYGVGHQQFAPDIDALSQARKIVMAGTILDQSIFKIGTFLPYTPTRLWYLLRGLKNDPFFPLKGYKLARKMATTGLDAHEAAIRFAPSNPNVTSGIFSTSSLQHVIQNAQAGQRPLAPEQLKLLVDASVDPRCP
jgi:aryl-alcohol dehydrogenase-like predicted oxidoreductase